MLILFTIASELESAKWLGIKNTITSFPKEQQITSNHDNNIVIRWGNSRTFLESTATFADYGEFPNVLNTSDAISDNCNKRNTLLKFKGKVPCPRLFETKVPRNVNAVYRPWEHAGGSGFLIKKGPFPIDYGMYATEFIQTDVEYRIWFCGDKTMMAKRYALKSNQVQEFNCRSQWGYSGITTSVPQQLHKHTLKAASIVNLQFGAADVLYKDGKYYFLELNSAPTLDTPMIANFYRGHLATLLREKFPTMFDQATVNELRRADPVAKRK
jgi:predicted ATP-grasp superfamily ATP-dependent carboligase